MKTTYQRLTKIPNVPCLYRHDDGHYYGKAKINGKIILKSFKGVTDRKLAEARLKVWLESMRGSKGANCSFESCCLDLLVTKKGRSKSVKNNANRYNLKLKEGFKGYTMPIYQITGLDIAKYFATLEMGVRDNNGFVEFVGNVFETAISAQYIQKSPIDKRIKKQIRKKQSNKPTDIPSVEEAEQIIEAMISKGKPDSEDYSKDYLKFLFLAGIGEAELNSLTWKSIDWKANRVMIERQKTGVYFYVPFYPWFKPFITDLWNRREKPTSGKIFNIKSIKQGIWNACDRLKLSRFSPRTFRKACIVRIIQTLTKDVALIAKWQGHQDNGVLVQRTYAYYLSSASDNYEKSILGT